MHRPEEERVAEYMFPVCLFRTEAGFTSRYPADGEEGSEQNCGCVFLHRDAPMRPTGRCLLDHTLKLTHLGPKPIGCVSLTCRPLFKPFRVPEGRVLKHSSEILGEWITFEYGHPVAP